MVIDTRHALLALTTGQVARLRDACNTRLTCVRGAAWLTIDGDRRDIVLSPGDSFVVETSAKVVIVALRAGAPTLEVAVDAPRRRCVPRRAGRLAGLLARLQARLAPPRAPAIAVA